MKLQKFLFFVPLLALVIAGCSESSDPSSSSSISSSTSSSSSTTQSLEKTYSLTFVGEHCSANNEPTFIEGHDVTFNITCEKYYVYPSSISFTGEGTYNYSSEQGKVTFNAHSDVIVSCSAIEVDPYTVTFNPNGGTILEGDAVQHVHEPSQIVPPTLSRIGYDFIGWDKNLSEVVTSSIVTALWQKSSTLTTELNLKGFTRVGDQFNLILEPSYPDFSIQLRYYVEVCEGATWKVYYDQACTAEIPDSDVPIGVGERYCFIKVFAGEDSKVYTVRIYLKDQYEVVFNANGGSSVPPIWVVEGDLITNIPTSTKQGYSLSWDYDFTTPVTSNLTIDAIWTPNVHKVEVTYNELHGSVTGGGNYDYDSSATLVAEPNSNYKFVGYYEGDNLLGNQLTYVISPIHRDYQINAVFAEKSKFIAHTISTNLKYGTVNGEVSGYAGSNVTLKASEKISNTFDGWYINGTKVSSSKEYSYTLGEEDVIAYAHFKDDDQTFLCSQNPETKELCMLGATAHGELDIPNYTLYNGDFYPLTSIAITRSFTNVNELFIPNTISDIPYQGLAFLNSLTKVTFESGGKITFGEEVFAECESLTQVIMPDDFDIKAIPELMFYSTGLTSFTCPKSVTTIGTSAFSYCKSLESIDFNGSKITTIEAYAFERSGLKSIDFPTSLVSIGEDAFFYCENLASVNFGDNIVLETIGEGAFATTEALKSINLPSCLKYLERAAFCGSGLIEITLPKGLTKVGRSSLSCCPNLVSVKYEEGFNCSEFEYGVFEYDNSLETIFIPKCIESIANSCFCSCDNLHYVNFEEGSKLVFIGEEAFCDCDIYSIGFPNNNIVMESCVFEDNDNLTSIYIPANMTTIPHGLVFSCASFNTITYENIYNVTTIRSSAFSYTSLTEFTLPPNVTTLGSSIFTGCENFSKFVFNDKISEVGSYMFWMCPSLEQIIIPTNVTKMGEDCFYQSPTVIYLEHESVPVDFAKNWNSERPYYLYSETPNYDGNHWHYNSSNQPEIWK